MLQGNSKTTDFYFQPKPILSEQTLLLLNIQTLNQVANLHVYVCSMYTYNDMIVRMEPAQFALSSISRYSRYR